MRFRGSLAAVWGRCIYTHKCTLSEICLRGILAAHWGICIYTYKYVHTSRWNSASLLKQCLIQNSALSKQHICTHFEMYIYVYILRDTGWRRLLGSPKLQIIFHKRATKYSSLLRRMTYKERDPMSLRHPVYIYMYTLRDAFLGGIAAFWGICSIHICTPFEMRFLDGLATFCGICAYIYIYVYIHMYTYMYTLWDAFSGGVMV